MWVRKLITSARWTENHHCECNKALPCLLEKTTRSTPPCFQLEKRQVKNPPVSLTQSLMWSNVMLRLCSLLLYLWFQLHFSQVWYENASGQQASTEHRCTVEEFVPICGHLLGPLLTRKQMQKLSKSYSTESFWPFVTSDDENRV